MTTPLRFAPFAIFLACLFAASGSQAAPSTPNRPDGPMASCAAIQWDALDRAQSRAEQKAPQEIHPIQREMILQIVERSRSVAWQSDSLPAGLYDREPGARQQSSLLRKAIEEFDERIATASIMHVENLRAKHRGLSALLELNNATADYIACANAMRAKKDQASPAKH